MIRSLLTVTLCVFAFAQTAEASTKVNARQAREIAQLQAQDINDITTEAGQRHHANKDCYLATADGSSRFSVAKTETPTAGSRASQNSVGRKTRN
ncbi:MAG: hypothetical protein RBT63_10425 [Bdellovibrionales bacterium]|nr:hypothetical protein [Bdellovibrionales bacterium]